MAAKRLLFGIVALCASYFSASAQYDPYWQWAKADTPSALNYSGGTSVLGVKNGKALWGRMTSNQTVVNGTVMGGWTFTEYDSLGKQTNSVTFGGKVQMIDAQADAAGNWYILGRFYDSLVTSGGTLTRGNPATNPDPDHFMLRLDAGSFYQSWFKFLSNINLVKSRAFTIDNSKIIIALDSVDATYVRSMSLSSGAFTPMFRQGGPSTTSSIVTDASGNIYMAGSCAVKGMLDFNGAVQPLSGASMAYIARYLFNYAHDWHHILNDQGCTQRKLTLFKDKFLYYTGTLNDSLTIGTMSVHPPLRSMDFVSARLDPTTGTPIWMHQVDTANQGEANLSEMAFHAAVTPDTALVVFSQANTYVNWGNNISTNLFGTYSSVVVSTGPTGNTRWARPVLADNVTDDRIVSEDNAIWVSGSAFTTTAVTKFDTLNLKMPARRWVPYIGKLKLIRPPFVTPPAGIGNISGITISASPNPARNAIRVSGLNGKSSLILRDLSGRAVSEQNTDGAEATLNVADLPRGAYFLQMKSADELPQVRKIVLE